MNIELAPEWWRSNSVANPGEHAAAGLRDWLDRHTTLGVHEQQRYAAQWIEQLLNEKGQI